MRPTSVRLIAGIWCVLLAASSAEAAPKLGEVVSGIELRYNRLATMQADFSQEMSYAGTSRFRETGTVSLLRPQKMRWDYTDPEGKLLISDSDWLRMYSPYTNQVSTVEMAPTADMRAPLAFLLGRVDLSRQFKNLRLQTIDGETALLAEGRSGREVYHEVEFYYSPEDFRLKRIRVRGRDDSITDFRFWNEKRNPKLDAALFVFEAPKGAELLPVTRLDGAQ